MTANLLHLVETDTFDIVESYISPVDMILNDVVIKAGSWMSYSKSILMKSGVKLKMEILQGCLSVLQQIQNI